MQKFKLTVDEMTYLGYFTDPLGHHSAVKKNDTPNIYFLDCEMIETTLGTEIASIGFGKKNNTDWETHLIKVKPKGTVVDYITHITGFDKDTIFDSSFEDAVQFLLDKIHENDILVGHHMYIDLKLLNLYHANVIDCCMVFHHPDGPPYYYSLKDLTKMHLKRLIQNGTHDPLEDGIASYDLIKWCSDNGYIKVFWQCIGEKFVPTIDHILKGLNLSLEHVICVYTRGSRAVGTNNPDSDYDLIVVFDSGCKTNKIINGTLTRYGNIDLCIYDDKYFEQLLKDHIIWAIECIYCPSDMIYIEKKDYRKFFEEYRLANLEVSNVNLRKSVGFESSRKVASSKRHFMNGDTKHAKKHIFIAIRFVDYGRQIADYNKLVDIREVNYVWDTLKRSEFESYRDFKNNWKDLYIKLSREFSRRVPKSLSSTDNKKSYMFPLYIRDKNSNLNLYILKVIQDSEEKEFLEHFPEYDELLINVQKVLDDFISKMKTIYNDTIKLCTNRRDFAVHIQGHDRAYHKYLFNLYDGIDLNTFVKTLTNKRLYNDIFVKKNETKERVINNYGYTPENKYGKYAEDVKNWEKIQIENSKKIVFTDQFDINTVRYVAGLDISFDKTDDTLGAAYITVFDIKDQIIVYEDHKKCVLNIPYISGFLGFREVPEYVALLNKLKTNKPEFYPDILMVDAFGILHYRGFGSASHIGFETNIPTIGVAKTLLYIDGLNEHIVKDKFRKECTKQGDCIELIGESGKIYGVAYKSTSDGINPIYITVGHNISIESCIKIVTLTTKYKIPEPIRNSDIKSKLYLK